MSATEAPADWVTQMFALCEGPEVGFRASLRRLDVRDGQTFIDFERGLRYTRAGLVMPQ